jgi:glycosyltransferase involved in cell wall biosynthesis
MQKQKTAVICLSPVNGGMELAALKLARVLSSDVEVEFIAKKDGFLASRPEHFENFPIKLHLVDFRMNFSIKLILRLRRIFIESKIKNIIFLGASEMKSLHFAAYGLGINFIIRQGSKKTTPKKDVIHKLLYSNVNHFVGNCEYIKQNILDILPVPESAKVHRIYSSLKLEENVVYKEFDGVIDLIHVGRVHPGKGQFETIRACEVLHQKGFAFSLKFLGDIQDKNYHAMMKKYLQTTEYTDSVEFVGYTSKVKQYLQKSDIFIFPSLGEGMSNAIIESLGFGLIPIIYNDTSSPEFKDLGFHLHLTKENSIESLQETLLKVAQNINDEKLQARQNHERALSVFAPQREKDEYMELLV